ncbi:MAG: HEAT repeat domain-containing protein [Pyrinomonadaceae bacterium]
MKSLLHQTRILRPLWFKGSSLCLLAAILFVIGPAAGKPIIGQGNERLTPIQREIERQRQRLNSADIEERRDALTRLGNLKRPDASRVAAAGLGDVEPIVRVTAAHAILSLPPADAAALLIPLLQDKLEFVRREAAYALGQTRSRTAVSPLANLLTSDKDAGVRGAAAVALGEIGDESAVPSLSQVLTGRTEKKKKAKTAEDEFVMRAAARSLGQIRSRSGVEVLIAALADDTNDNDVRREAATALGLIGDPSAAPALQAAFASSDPYLSEAAREALRLIKLAGK